MSDKQAQAYPFVAECRSLHWSAPFQWLNKGFQDVRSAPFVSLLFGTIMATLIMSVTFLAWRFGGVWLMFSLLCGFVFFAPIACIATYAVSAQLERAQPVSLARAIRACFKRYIGSELVFTLALLIVFLVWARASSMASIFIPSDPDLGAEQMLNYIMAISSIALLFLSITFAISVFSLPMIMHRDVDVVTAVVSSVNAVLRNKLVMVLWGFLIASLIVIGILSAGLLLVVFLPAIGHAVWHGYRHTINADPFPRHTVGITSTEASI